jgi:mycothiol synthase
VTIDDRIQQTGQLDQPTRTTIMSLLRAADDADGTFPVSEAAMLHLRHDSSKSITHLLARSSPDGPAIGYGQVDSSDLGEGPVVELVVHPAHRHRGLGRALVSAAVHTAARLRERSGWTRIWAHGNHPSAAALALSLGFTPCRTLHQMRRSLLEPFADPVLPAGVALRAFRQTQDENTWLKLNARAFADLPDQSGWTIADLRSRFTEPWWDPTGFLLAEQISDGELVGFHWTKVHPARNSPTGVPASSTSALVGEVYVLGVAPEYAGQGLGTALALAGFQHLRRQGLERVMLYVDQSNPAAVSLYRRLGFQLWATDVCFRLS